MTAPLPRTAVRGPAAQRPEALLHEGLAHHQAGRLSAAEAAYVRVIEADPANADAHNLLGLVALARGDADRARRLISKAVKRQPKSALFQFNLGKAEAAAGARPKAIAALGRAIKLKPDWAEAWNSLGVLHAEAGDARRAEHALRRAVKCDSGSAEAWNNLGLVLAKAGRQGEALAALEAGVNARPDYPVVLNSLGALARDMGDIERSVAVLEKAVALAPDYFEAVNNLGVSLLDARRFEDARARLEDAVRRNPAHAESWRSLAKARAALGRTEDALAACERALAAPGADARCVWERALIRLAARRFADAWPDYRARPMVDRARWPVPDAPLAQDLRERRFAVIAEQGLGEELFFLRFAEALKARDAHVAVEVDARLKRMVERIGLFDAVAEKGAEHGGAEQVLMGDLPYLAGAGDAALPPLPVPALAHKRADVAERLEDAGPGPYLALTWRAGIKSRATLFKEAPMDLVVDACRDWPGTVIALQRGPEAGEVADVAGRMGRAVADLTDLNDDLEGMLALMGAIDAYAGVSNTNMHLAAAARAAGANVACHVLVTAPAEFRWCADGDASPWFPGFRLHREDAVRGWGRASASLSSDLRKIRPNN